MVIGVIFGAAAVWILDRRHQKTVEKLIESRRKIERQRTQAVNDLFAFRAEVGNNPAPVNNVEPEREPSQPDPQLLADMENLRALVGRADAALASARINRDEQDAEIAQLRAQIEVLTDDRADVIDLHPEHQHPANGYNMNYGRV